MKRLIHELVEQTGIPVKTMAFSQHRRRRGDICKNSPLRRVYLYVPNPYGSRNSLIVT